MKDLSEILKDDEALSGILAILGQKTSQGSEMPINPSVDPKKAMLGSTMKGMGSSVLSGAGAGASVGGPVGAAIGGGAMLLKELITLPGKMKEMNEVSDDWAGNIIGKSSSVGKYAKGGRVVGKGTATSDDIKANLKEGSFVVPSKNADKAISYGKKHLGWDKSRIKKIKQSLGGDQGVDAMVSNGEVIFTPEETSKLQNKGIDLNYLAESNDYINKYSDGGLVTVDLSQNKMATKNMLPDSIDQLNQEDWLTPGEGTNVDPINTIKTDSDYDSFMKYLPEAAATAQMIGGVVGTISAGRRPDVNISRHLQQIASETAKDAGYGLDPGTKASIKSSQERSRRVSANDIINRGGSTQDQMQNLIALDANKLESDRQLELDDYREKQRKKGINQNIKMKMADQDMAVQGDQLRSFHETQNAFAEMLGAGIGNIIGAREYKDTLDVMRETKDRSVFK